LAAVSIDKPGRVFSSKCGRDYVRHAILFTTQQLEAENSAQTTFWLYLLLAFALSYRYISRGLAGLAFVLKELQCDQF
jgi:hypothetical protein